MARRDVPAGERGHSLSQVAALLRVSRQEVSRWITQGCPTLNQADRDHGVDWELDLAAVAAWRTDRAVDEAVKAFGADGEMTLAQAKRRRAAAEATLAEIELERVRGEIVDVSYVSEKLAVRFAEVRSKLGTLGAMVAGRAATLTAATEIQALIDAEIIAALESLVDPWDPLS